MDLKLSILRAMLKFKTRPGRIKKALHNLIRNREFPPHSEDNNLEVAALQLQLELLESVEEYVEWLGNPVLEARNAGSRLIVLPEYVNLPLLGLIPGIENSGQGEELNPGDIFRFVSPYFFPVYRRILSYLAAQLDAYIAGGSFLLQEAGSLYNTAFLFDNRGKVILKQPKLNLMPLEDQWGITPGEELNTCQVGEDVRVSMPVCMDATYFETFRILRALGANVVLVPIADANPDYSQHMALRGIWARVQETPVYGVKSALVGGILDFKLSGRAGIYAPAELTPHKQGILAESPDAYSQALIRASLNMQDLRRVQEQWPEVNPDLCRQYFPDLYHNIE